DDPVPETKTQFTIDAGLSGIQLGAEIKTGKTQTIQLRGGVLPFLYTEYDFNNGKDRLGFTGSICFSAEYRFYYNFLNRIEKHKDVRNNGANYAGFIVLYSGRPFKAEVNSSPTSAFFMAGPIWGFNRPLGENVLFHISLGPVYEKHKIYESGNITFYGDLRWSFRIK
ncbi:MAG: hypothetical protein ACXWCZ_03670, partial [Flavisolibacter sp.]